MTTNVKRLLSAENLQTLPRGRRFFRVFWDHNSPKAYGEANLTHPWRFSPVEIPNQPQPIQGLYFADTAASCMRETIFRKGQTAVVPINAVRHRQCIEAELKSDLTVYLMTSQLLTATLGFDPLMNNDYPVCIKLAQVLLSHFPKLQGIVFQSYQTDANSLNLVTFSHNTPATTLRFKHSTRDHLLSARYRGDLLAAASAADRELSSHVRDICLGKVALI